MTFNCSKRRCEFVPASSRIWCRFVIISMVLLFALQPTGCHSDWLQNCSSCHCNWNSGKKTADCKNKALAIVPRDLSTELQVIDLSNNAIPELRRDEFQEANLQNLHKIFMRNCTLLELNRDALKSLAILIELDLSHNFITELHPATFSGLAKLRNLVMNNNDIEVLPNYLFAQMNFLSRVEFKHNRLKRIEVHAFGHLPLLSAVYLESNELTVLRRETFARTPKLLHLSLAQNPWNCSCELQEFRDYAVTHRLYTPPTDCRDPPHLRGKLWSEVPSDNFACEPRVLGPVRSYVEVQGENVTLPCRFIASPQPNVTWIYNKRLINTNDNRLHVHNYFDQNYVDHTNILTTELRIYGVRAADKGSYTCVADNRGGRAEADIQLIVNGQYPVAIEDIDANVTNDAATDAQNMLLVIALITTILLLVLIIVVFAMCWYSRRIKAQQKDSSFKTDNGLMSSKVDNSHNCSLLEGSVIMEMQKSLLTDVNPVEKPPRRNDIEYADGNEDGHDTKRTLLNETQFGNHRDDETQSVALSDTTPRSRHTYVDDGYGSSLPPDLLAFPAHVPNAPSIQSSQSNITDQVVYGLRSPLSSSPVYAHMTPRGIYGTTTAPSNAPNGFMTLQHPCKRSLTLFAASNSRQQQSPFVPAPVIYPSSNVVVMKQGYMTIPRKPRVPSWAPSSSTQTAQLGELQATSSPNSIETTTTNTSELHEPVYDNLGLRTTAGGNSTLNLHKITQEQPIRYTMRDRPLPATPNIKGSAINCATQKPSAIGPISAPPTGKIYEPIHELNVNCSTTSESEPLYGLAKQNNGIAIVPAFDNNVYGTGLSMLENKVAKIPPRPPPKPKKKMTVTATRYVQGSRSQLFEDEGEDGTEV